MLISFAFRTYLRSELEKCLVKRDILKEDFSAALALGDEIENAPLDFARQARDMNENRINEVKKLLQLYSADSSMVEDKILIGTAFKAMSEINNEEIILILSSPEFSNVLPSGIRALSIATPIGADAFNKSINDKFCNYRILHIYSDYQEIL